jgi:glutaredoxin
MKQDITIYTQPTCQTCHQLKRYLKQKGIEYNERNVIGDEEAFKELQALGYSSTPVVVIGDEVMGFDLERIEQLLTANKVNVAE